MLYEADLRSVATADVLAERVLAADPPVNPYTIELVDGVRFNSERTDEILSQYSEGWTLERMPPLDRAILRLGIYELLWQEEVPSAVVIDEAVELAKTLSTDESPKFVNGVLARVLRDASDLRVAV